MQEQGSNVYSIKFFFSLDGNYQNNSQKLENLFWMGFLLWISIDAGLRGTLVWEKVKLPRENQPVQVGDHHNG